MKRSRCAAKWGQSRNFHLNISICVKQKSPSYCVLGGTGKLSSGFSLKRPTSISSIEPYDPLFVEYPHILSPNHALGARIRYPVEANGFDDVL